MTPSAPQSQPALSVLLVEDSPSQAIRFKTSLESGGCQVHWAENGQDGLQAAREKAFDLIILDVELPEEIARAVAGVSTTASEEMC